MALSARRRAAHNAGPEENKQRLVDMPLEVLIEIFLYLEPVDLLYLARTTKRLRQFLLSPNKCTALWKNTISNIDLPPCPDHLSAPAYAHLAFVPECHGCFKPCETIEWELRMRLCPACMPKLTVPRSHVFRTACGYLDQVDLPMTSHQYKLDADRGVEVMVISIHIFFRSFSRLDWIDAKRRKRPKKVTMEEFVEGERGHWGSIRRHARACQAWEIQRLNDKAAQLTQMRRQRIEDIKAKLRGLGWKPSELEMHCDYDFVRLPEVKKLEPLTPSGWNKIQSQLISWLERAREGTIWSQRVWLFDSAFLNVQQELKSDPSLRVRPQRIDIFMLPAVRSMIEGSIHSDMGQDDLKKKFSRMLPQAVRKWSASAVDELERFAQEELNLSHLSKPSRLPWIVFRCKTCHKRFRFDDALSHSHLYKDRAVEKMPDDASPYEKQVMLQGQYPRDIGVLRVDAVMSRRAENLVKRMGQNPNRVTFDELCRSSLKVVCGLCHLKAGTRMDFEHAFEHCLSAHLRKKETEVWSRTSAREDVPTTV